MSKEKTFNSFGDFEEEDLKLAIANSFSIGNVLSFLKRSKSGTNYNLIRKYIKNFNIDVSHFNKEDYETIRTKYTVENISAIFIKNSTVSRGTIKKIILRLKLLKYKCNLCSIVDSWNGKKLVLRLDHIDGDGQNNTLENLRFLCPNCDSQTETYCGKNHKNKKEKVKINRSFFGLPKIIRKTKIEWPSTENLLKELETKSFKQLGKELGVSDNSVIKRLRSHPIKQK